MKRQAIITLLKETLEPLSFVNALWLEGADALGSVDMYSDIDFWLDVKDGFEDKAFDAVVGALTAHGKLDLDHEVNHADPQIRQRFLRLNQSSEFLMLDLCIQSSSREFSFTPKADAILPLFDKAAVLKFSEPKILPIQKASIEILASFEVHKIWIEKALAKESYLEAHSNYYHYAFQPFVKLLRLKHCPAKRDFGLKHVYLDLPNEACLKLEHLAKVSSLAEIEMKYKLLSQCIRDLVEDLSA